MAERLPGSPERQGESGTPVEVDGYPGTQLDEASPEAEMARHPNPGRELYLRGEDGNIVGVFQTVAVDPELGSWDQVVAIDLSQNEAMRRHDPSAQFQAQVLGLAELAAPARIGADYRIGQVTLPNLTEIVTVDRDGVKIVPGDGPLPLHRRSVGIRGEFRRRLKLAPRRASDVYGHGGHAGPDKAM